MTSELARCGKHWDEILGRASKFVEPIVGKARSFYIGRSSFPERRLLEHFRDGGRNHMAVLHWSSSAGETAKLEECLIAEAKGAYRGKTANKDRASSGRWEGPWHAVYASWSWKNAVPPENRFRGNLVRSLHARPLVPTLSFSAPIELISVDPELRAEQIDDLIDEWLDTRADQRWGHGRGR